MVSKEMVDELKLHRETHPHPYQIAWFKKGNEVTINKICLVKFSIGKTYKDEVWCDFVMIDACHLLLGRPCKYDKKFMHDGETNTYTFCKDGSKVVLFPLKDEGKYENMLYEIELVNKMKAIGFSYALIVKKEPRKTYQSLLKWPRY
jgi:hypothetical protein